MTLRLLFHLAVIVALLIMPARALAAPGKVCERQEWFSFWRPAVLPGAANGL